MLGRKRPSLAIVCALLLSSSLNAEVKVLKNFTLIDGTGRSPVAESAMIVNDGRITWIGRTAVLQAPAGAEIVDLTGKFVMPGIINLHGHIGNTVDLTQDGKFYTRKSIEENLHTYATYGVTAVQSMGTDQDLIYQVRSEQRAGRPSVARVYTAGQGSHRAQCESRYEYQKLAVHPRCLHCRKPGQMIPLPIVAAVYEGVNELQGRVFPSSERRGGCAIKKMLRSLLMKTQTGWSVPDNVTTSTFTIMTTPSAPLRWLRAFFFLAQPPLLFQEGNTLSWQFIHTFYERHIANIRRGKFRTEENSYTSFPETSRCFSSNSAQRAYSASTAFSASSTSADAAINRGPSLAIAGSSSAARLACSVLSASAIRSSIPSNSRASIYDSFFFPAAVRAGCALTAAGFASRVRCQSSHSE